MMKILCEKDIKFVSRFWGLLLEDFGVIARSFDKSQKLITHYFLTIFGYNVFFQLSFRYLCRVSK